MSRFWSKVIPMCMSMIIQKRDPKVFSKVGHIAKDCWREKRGKGKGHDQVGRRDRGKDGRWYRRTSPGDEVSSWVIDGPAGCQLGGGRG